MQQNDLNKVVFYSKEDLSCSNNLQKVEQILRSDLKSNYTDINEILELYNINKYIDNGLYLKSWTHNDIKNYKLKVEEYRKIIGKFMSNIDDKNVISIHDKILHDYIHSFWQIVNDQGVFKKISKVNFNYILTNDSYLIYEILIHKRIVNYYDEVIKTYLLSYSKSAEILLSVYEVVVDLSKVQKFIPKTLTKEEKEVILSNYLDSDEVNYNYIELIQNVRNKRDFYVSSKTRLKAKRLHKKETEKIFAENNGVSYGVTVSFLENVSQIKNVELGSNYVRKYTYSVDFIKRKNDVFSLFQNFKKLFEYVDLQNRVNLVSKKSKLSVLERTVGVHSKNEYRKGAVFNMLEMTSHAQIAGYNKVLSDLKISLIDVLHQVFTSLFQKKYDFADNASFSIPSVTSYFEKVRLLAPEFESVLKQFKLYVEDGRIDFELLQISSNPITIKEIPSLNPKKYIYLNTDNKEVVGCINLFFSNQSHLHYVDSFKDKNYNSFFELITNEQIQFSDFEEYQKDGLNFLIEMEYLALDNNDFIKINNLYKVLILKDLYYNEVTSFYRCSNQIQQEALRMECDKVIFFNSSLFTKPEQEYFNYYLNKSEFTNGLDLRNRYLHGTQASSSEVEKHEYAYFTYLKLLVLTFLKIEDDLAIHKMNK